MIERLGIALHQRQKFFFIAFNLVIVAIGIGLAMPAYDVITGRDEQIATDRETLARLQSIASLETEVQAAARRPEAQQDQGEFLVGPNDGAIGADLQTRLKTIAERNGARIRTMQGIPTKIVEPLRYISVQLTIFGNLQHIHSTMAEIETGKPYLFITDATIKLAAPLARGASEEPVVDARLEVSGVASAVRQAP